MAGVDGLASSHGLVPVTDAARAVLARLRNEIASGLLDEAALRLALQGIVGGIEGQLRQALGHSLRPVINATGVILHTNLGREPLAESAFSHMRETAGRFSNLEFDIEAGERGKRDVHVNRLFGSLLSVVHVETAASALQPGRTQAENFSKVSTIVVNNNAAAVLLALNTLAFLFEVWIEHVYGRQGLDSLTLQLGMVPARFTVVLFNHGYVPWDLISGLGTRYVPGAAAMVPIFTSMFLHGSWLHLIFNMWALWIFGDNVEDYLGHTLYLVLYLASGVAASLLHTLFNLGSTIPSVGASGAIAGVMGAYFVLYPRARVLTLVPFFFVFFMWLPAWIVLGYWFIAQFLSGAATSIAAHGSSSSGIAFWAHVGGFIAGVLLVKLFPARTRRYHYGM